MRSGRLLAALDSVGRRRMSLIAVFPLGADWATPPELESAGVQEIETYDLTGSSEESFRAAEWDLLLGPVPIHLGDIGEECLAAAVSRGALVAWLAFEGSPDLLAQSSANLYGLARLGSVQLALDDDYRSGSNWEEQVREAEEFLAQAKADLT